MTPTTKEDPISYGDVKFGTKTHEVTEPNYHQIPGEAQLWSLFYRHKGVFRYRIFALEGTRQDAIERAKQHCAIQGLKLEWVEEAICDLDYLDNKTLKGL